MYPKKYPFYHKVLVKLYQKNIPFTTKYFISFKPILCILNVLAFQTSLISKHVFIIRVFPTKKGYTASLPIIIFICHFHFGSHIIYVKTSRLGFGLSKSLDFSECAAALFITVVSINLAEELIIFHESCVRSLFV